MRFVFQRSQQKRGDSHRSQKFAPAFEALEQRTLLSASVFDPQTSAVHEYYQNTLTCIPYTEAESSLNGLEETQTGAADAYGRVKLQSHWDRPGSSDGQSSCWMRTSQVHTSGGIDRPIVVGCIYHAESMPPFGLPGSAVPSGLISSTVQGSGDFDEYVTDDTSGREKIRLHAQYDMDSTVADNQSQTVGASQTVTVGAVRSVKV